MPFNFRHAICNEAFDKWAFADACKAIRRIGYSGIEIAPFTLAEDPATIAAAQRREYCAIMRNEGLEFVGLHWLYKRKSALLFGVREDAEHVTSVVDERASR